MAAAQADEIADVLPEGRDTVLNHQAGSLSGGQRIVLSTNPALLVVTHRVVILEYGLVTVHGNHVDPLHTDARCRELVLS